MTLPVPALNFPALTSAIGRRYVSPFVRAKITIYPHQQDPVYPLLGRGRRSTDAVVVSWDAKATTATLRELTWKKYLGAPSGEWAVAIKERKGSSLDIEGGDIMPDDWVRLSLNINGLEVPICCGVIDTVTKETVGAGATHKTWRLTGRDHGAVFEYPIAYNNLFVQTLKEIVQGLYTQRVQGKIGGSPDEMFGILINAAIRGPEDASTPSFWLMPDSFPDLPFRGAPFSEMLEVINDTPTRGGYYCQPQLWTRPGDGLYQTLGAWCNPLLNEMILDLDLATTWPDTGPVGAKIMALIRERPLPFVSESLGVTLGDPSTAIQAGLRGPWFKLQLWEIPNWFLRNADVGRSSQERFNLFELMADLSFMGSQVDQCAVAPPAWWRESIERHGLRPMLETSRFVARDNQSLAQWQANRRDWQQLLVEWYCLNPWMWSGQLTMPVALPYVRVGQRCRVTSGNPATDWTYYVEGAQLSWRAGEGANSAPTSQTVLSVTRGWKGDELGLLNAISTVAGKYKAVF